MDLNFIRKALRGEVEWFDPNKDYSEEDFIRGIKASEKRFGDDNVPLRLVEELTELNQSICDLIISVSKFERDEGDVDNWMNLHEEIGDALWAIGVLVESRKLNLDLIKKIRRLKDEKNVREKGA